MRRFFSHGKTYFHYHLLSLCLWVVYLLICNQCLYLFNFFFYFHMLWKQPHISRSAASLVEWLQGHSRTLGSVFFLAWFTLVLGTSCETGGSSLNGDDAPQSRRAGGPGSVHPGSLENCRMWGCAGPVGWHLPAFRAAHQPALPGAAPPYGQVWSQGEFVDDPNTVDKLCAVGKKLSCVLPNTLCPRLLNWRGF